MPNRRDQDELLAWFFRFFEFADGRYAAHQASVEPLYEFTTCWLFWWHAELTHDQKAQIEALVTSLSGGALDNFVGRLHDWLAGRFSSRGAAVAVLRQLPEVPLLQDWREAVRSRVESLMWINFVGIFESNGGSSASEIIPLCAFLRPRQGDRVKCAKGIALNPTGVAGAYDAVRSLVSGCNGLLLVVLGFLSGWPTSSRLLRGIVLLGWFVVTCGAIGLVLYGQDLERSAVIHGVYGVIFLGGLLLLYPLFFLLRDLLFASHLAHLLSQKEVGILSGWQKPGAVLSLKEPSYSLALGVAILAALLEEAESGRKSWLWGKLAEWVRSGRPHWVFTGVLSATGWIEKVTREKMQCKYGGCLRGDDLTDFVTPWQAPKLPAVASKPVQSTPSGGVGSSVLRVHRSLHLATLVLRLSGVRSATASLTAGLALSSAVALCFAVPDMSSHRINVSTDLPHDPKGGSETMITGTVDGITKENVNDYHIVIYSRTGQDWYVQPDANRPITDLDGEGKFEREIYTGYEYAIQLVSPLFGTNDAPAKTRVLPAVDGRKVLKEVRVRGAAPQ